MVETDLLFKLEGLIHTPWKAINEKSSRSFLHSFGQFCVQEAHRQLGRDGNSTPDTLIDKVGIN